MRMRSQVGLTLAMVLMVVAMAGWVVSATDGNTLLQVMRPDDVGLVLTGTDVAPSDVLEGFEIGFWMLTPNFAGKAEAKGLETTVIVVVDDQVTSVVSGSGANLPAIPDVPVDGYVLIGSGIADKFLREFRVGDPIEIVHKERIVFDPTPKMVITIDGAFRDISAIDRGRRADELIVYTPNFGTHSLTNEWGIEVAVEDGVVVARRGYQDTGLFAIPEDGYVLSGHGDGNSWVDGNLSIGQIVHLSD